MINKANLEPDIVTYGVLALGCKTREEAWDLIDQMNLVGIKMNMPILGAMVKQGCCSKNFDYVMDILNIIRTFKMKPSEQLLETLNRFITGLNMEKKKDQKNYPLYFRKNVKNFKEKFQKWKDEMGIGKIEDLKEVKHVLKEKPWEQFQEAQASGYEEPKNQQMQLRRKTEHHIKLIKAREEMKKSYPKPVIRSLKAGSQQ
jgi:pentatricopeptide repeat domain-containing protein 1